VFGSSRVGRFKAIYVFRLSAYPISHDSSSRLNLGDWRGFSPDDPNSLLTPTRVSALAPRASLQHGKECEQTAKNRGTIRVEVSRHRQWKAHSEHGCFALLDGAEAGQRMRPPRLAGLLVETAVLRSVLHRRARPAGHSPPNPMWPG
jgi:hypothetical protein